VEVHALSGKRMVVSAIARHLGRDRKTVRAYLNGKRVPGSGSPRAGPFERFGSYCRIRFGDDRTCGPRRCSMRSRAWGMRGRTRRSPGRSAGHGLRPRV